MYKLMHRVRSYTFDFCCFYRAMHFSAKRGIAIVYCPSVCPCITFRYRDHIGWNSSKIISRPNSLRPLLPGWSQHGPSGATGTPPKLGWNMAGVTRERQKPAISPKWCKIGPRLLLRTTRKSYTRFRLAPKSPPSGDLERRIQGLPNVFLNTRYYLRNR